MENIIIGKEIHRSITEDFDKFVSDKTITIPARSTNITITGPPGSGKTWEAYSIAEQLHKSGVTFLNFDYTGSYIGNQRPNVAYAKQLQEMGMTPMGINGLNIHIVSPSQFCTDANALKQSGVTDLQKYPLQYATLNEILDICKFNQKLYSNIKWENIKTFDDIRALRNTCNKTQQLAITMLLSRMEGIFTEGHSAIGSIIRQTIETKTPKWIVFTSTLQFSDHIPYSLCVKHPNINNEMQQIVYDFLNNAIAVPTPSIIEDQILTRIENIQTMYYHTTFLLRELAEVDLRLNTFGILYDNIDRYISYQRYLGTLQQMQQLCELRGWFSILSGIQLPENITHNTMHMRLTAIPEPSFASYTNHDEHYPLLKCLPPLSEVEGFADSSQPGDD